MRAAIVDGLATRMASEGATDEEGRVILLAPDADVPLGSRIH